MGEKLHVLGGDEVPRVPELLRGLVDLVLVEALLVIVFEIVQPRQAREAGADLTPEGLPVAPKAGCQ